MQAGMSPAKARHNLDDMHRWARFRGVPFALPAGHPRRTVEALRWVHACAPSERWHLSRAIYRAYWVDGLDVGQRDVLATIAAEAGAGAESLGAIDSPEVKQALWDATNGAIVLGIFGVPSFMVDDALYWGQDRLHFVEAALSGRHSSEVLV
jgi:2-hydroxychromene-2-carboxylate isomerase